MARPVVGIIGNPALLDESYPVFNSGVINCTAVAEAAGAVPMIVPTDPALVSVEEILEICDGILLTGARPNVHAEEYGEEHTEAHGDCDRARDAITLPLTRACVAAGQPVLGICRGFQEMNVALGGTLHPEIRDLPGRMNHRMPPEGTLEEKFALRHPVRFTEGGPFHRLLGSIEVMTNSLHGQGLARTGRSVVIDGRAEDGTPEALYVEGAPGFAMGVQWHAEWNAARDPVSRALFAAFGAALERWAGGERPSAERLRSA